MGVLWRDVLIPDSVVASDGLTAELGGVVEMPLLLHCRYRTSLGPQVPRVSGAHDDTTGRWVHDLTGRVVEADSSVWTDGWLIDVGGPAVYVQEVGGPSGRGTVPANYVREPGSDPAAPLPQPGSWVRVRGEISVAEAYQTDGFEPAEELARRAELRWHVRRIVRLDHPVRAPGPLCRTDVAVMNFADLRYRGRRRTAGYLLDLDQP